MQILIKKINEVEPTIVLNDVFMIYEDDCGNIEFHFAGGILDNEITIISKADLEYFRKVGD